MTPAVAWPTTFGDGNINIRKKSALDMLGLRADPLSRFPRTQDTECISGKLVKSRSPRAEAVARLTISISCLPVRWKVCRRHEVMMTLGIGRGDITGY